MLVSVITPVHRPAFGFLSEAWASLRDQALPEGTDFEWLIQTDGEVAEELPPELAADDRIRFCAGPKDGVATARNLALGRSAGDYVKVLDADDRLAPGALARDLAALGRGYRWVVSSVLDVGSDQTTPSRPHIDPPEGELRAGFILDFWLEHDYRLPVHPATLIARRSTLLELGGWMGIEASEDTGLLIALGEVCPGYFVAEPGLFYRKWPGQSTAAASYARHPELRYQLIAERGQALRSRRLSADREPR